MMLEPNNMISDATNNITMIDNSKYLVLKIVCNCVEVFHVKAETANTAIILAKRYDVAHRKIFANTDMFGEGMIALKVDSAEQETTILNQLEHILKGYLTGILH